MGGVCTGLCIGGLWKTRDCSVLGLTSSDCGGSREEFSGLAGTRAPVKSAVWLRKLPGTGWSIRPVEPLTAAGIKV